MAQGRPSFYFVGYGRAFGVDPAVDVGVFGRTGLQQSLS
jgi:hypothetical protein